MKINAQKILRRKMSARFVLSFLAVVMSTGTAVADDDARAAAEINNTGINLSQAIRTAQTSTRGVAYEAELENENGVWLFEVETIASNNVIWKSYINVNNGELLRKKVDDSYEHTVGAIRAALSNVSLLQAIAAVENRLGGKAYEADLEKEDGTWLFEVEVADTSGGISEAYVNPTSGAVSVSSTDSSSPDSGDDVSDVDVVDAYELETSLIDAITTAESVTGGRAYDAELDAVNGRWFYEVEVVLVSGERRELRISAYTGAVFSNKSESGPFNLIDNRDIRNMNRTQIRGTIARTRALCRRASTSAAVRACLRRHSL